MRASAEERRETVRALRELAMRPEIDGDVNMYDLIDAARMELGRYLGFVTPEAAERPADLIGRPTRALADGGRVTFDAVGGCDGYAYPRFCPWCGREVRR